MELGLGESQEWERGSGLSSFVIVDWPGIAGEAGGLRQEVVALGETSRFTGGGAEVFYGGCAVSRELEQMGSNSVETVVIR